jgi:hypothetical protein
VCLFIKDWFKPIFPLFLTSPLREVSNTRYRVAFPLPPNAIGQVTPMPGKRQEVTIVSVAVVLTWSTDVLFRLFSETAASVGLRQRRR